MSKKKKGSARKRADRQRTILAIPSDEHSGSSVGLMPGDGWLNSEGQMVYPNDIQKVIWNQWRECWEFVAELRGNNDTRVIVVNAGDAIDGVHHSTTQLVTFKVDEMARIHTTCMIDGLRTIDWDRDKGDDLFYVMGTESHNGHIEDQIARMMDATPAIPSSDPEVDDGEYIWRKIKRRINGRYFNIAHEGPGAGSRAWLKGNIMRWVLDSMYWECLEYGLELPDYWVRAHRHQWIPPQYFSGEHGAVWGFLTPAFQAKTDYVYQKFSASEYSNIGMLVFEIESSGAVQWHKRSIVVKDEEVIDL